MSDTLKFKRLRPDANIPSRAHADDAGLDLYCTEDFTLPPREGRAIPTGIAFAIPERHVGLISDRSSMAKKGLKTAGGIIDAGYRGEVHIVVWNISAETVQVKSGERIAQMMVVPIAIPALEEVSELDQTQRGSKGFGSTGR